MNKKQVIMEQYHQVFDDLFNEISNTSLLSVNKKYQNSIELKTQVLKYFGITSLSSDYNEMIQLQIVNGKIKPIVIVKLKNITLNNFTISFKPIRVGGILLKVFPELSEVKFNGCILTIDNYIRQMQNCSFKNCSNIVVDYATLVNTRGSQFSGCKKIDVTFSPISYNYKTDVFDMENNIKLEDCTINNESNYLLTIKNPNSYKCNFSNFYINGTMMKDCNLYGCIVGNILMIKCKTYGCDIFKNVGITVKQVININKLVHRPQNTSDVFSIQEVVPSRWFTSMNDLDDLEKYIQQNYNVG